MHFTLALRLTGLALITLLIGAAAPFSPVPITGRWTPVGSDCTVTDGAVRITARTLVADEIACRFDSAAPSSRPGAWTGRCAMLDDGMKSVVALRSEGRTLTIAYDGGPATTYRRCSYR